jgi:threonine synthase
MNATIMSPASTSPAKTVQMRAHGAKVQLVPGSRQDTADAAVAAHGGDGGKLFYSSHNWHPFFLHGTKTLAYELWCVSIGRPSSAPDRPLVVCMLVSLMPDNVAHIHVVVQHEI